MEITNLINSVGFPIVVCLWFMFKTEKIIKGNTKAIQELTKEIKILKIK